LSELFMGYGEYLHDQEGLNQPYGAAGLSSEDQGFEISSDSVTDLRHHMSAGLSEDSFDRWLCEYLSGSSNEELSELEEREVVLSTHEMRGHLDGNQLLKKSSYVKLAVTKNPTGGVYLGLGGETRFVDGSYVGLVNSVISECPFRGGEFVEDEVALSLVTELYNLQVLEFTSA